MKKKYLYILITVFLLSNSNVFAQNSTEKLKQKLQAKLDEWHKNANFPGATIGVTLADGKSFGLATGYSDRVKKTPMKPDDLMLAGSVGKTYVAAVALQLVKEGKINLDDKIEKYFGDEEWFSRLPNAKDITVRHLMNHTSGLVRYEFNPNFVKDLLADPYKDWKPREQIAYLFDSKAAFEAGKGWDYSDTNYIVLGMIIEKVTGKNYYDLVKDRILKPLKLKKTKPQTSPKIEGLVQGYAGSQNPFGGNDEVLNDGKMPFNPAFEWTGGGMVSNAQDLSRWAKFMYEGKAFDKSLLPEMFEGVSAPQLGKETKYGLGVIIRPTSQGITYGHSGFFPGYMTDVMYFPEEKIAIAVQVNSSVPQNLGKPLGRVLVEAAEILINQNKQSNQNTSQEEEILKTNIERYLNKAVSEHGFSGSVLVAKENKILLHDGYGWADLKKSSPVKDETKFYIASISKQFAAAAILKLEEQRRLSVNDSITKFFKDVPADKSNITIHQLLTHTSGLPHNYAADGIADRNEAIRAILKEPLKAKPGEKFGYSNDGYSLLAAIVEIASSETFESFLGEYLLKPAEMTRTGFWGEPTANGKESIAQKVEAINENVKLPNWGFRGASGMYSTTGDLLKWQQSLFQTNRILNEASRQKLLMPYSATSVGGYGYGWFITDTNSGKIIWTSGTEGFGHNAIIKIYSNGAVIIIASNAGNISGAAASKTISAEIEKIVSQTK